MPETLDGGVRHAVVQCTKDDPSEFTVLKSVVEAFETRKFLHHSLRHPTPAAGGNDLDRVRQQTQQALLLEAPCEAAHRFRVGAGFLSALRRGAVLKEHQRADEFIAPLHRVAEQFLELGKVLLWLHARLLSLRVPIDVSGGDIVIDWRPASDRSLWGLTWVGWRHGQAMVEGMW